MDSLLDTYLNDHLAGATAGVELFRRARHNQAGTDRGPTLATLCAEVEQDLGSLERIMSNLGIRRNTSFQVVAWFGEKAGRLKPNGYVLRRSPLSDVVELEALRSAVAGKTAGWQVLMLQAESDPRLAVGELESLIRGAESQARLLRELHLRAAGEKIAGGSR